MPATDTQKVVNNAVVLAANDSILVELEERTPREPSSAMANGIPGLTQLNEDMVTLTPRVNISFKPAGGIAEVGPNRFQYGMPAPAQSSGQDLPKLAVEWTVIPTNSAPPSECAIVAQISAPDGKIRPIMEAAAIAARIHLNQSKSMRPACTPSLWMLKVPAPPNPFSTQPHFWYRNSDVEILPAAYQNLLNKKALTSVGLGTVLTVAGLALGAPLIPRRNCLVWWHHPAGGTRVF